MAEDGEGAACAHLFELSSSEFGDGVADVSEGFVSLELGSEDGEVGEGLEANVLFHVRFVADVLHIDFIADVGKKGGESLEKSLFPVHNCEAADWLL